MHLGDLALHYEALWAVSLELWREGKRGDAFTYYMQEMRQAEHRETSEGDTAGEEFLKYIDKIFVPRLRRPNFNAHSALNSLFAETYSTSNSHTLAWVTIEKQLISAYFACALGNQDDLARALREIDAQTSSRSLTRSQTWRATWLRLQGQAAEVTPDGPSAPPRPSVSRAEYRDAEFLRDFHVRFGRVIEQHGVRSNMDRAEITRMLEAEVEKRLPNGGSQRLMVELQGEGGRALPDELRLVIWATVLEVPANGSVMRSRDVAKVLRAQFSENARAVQAGQESQNLERFRARIRELGASLFN